MGQLARLGDQAALFLFDRFGRFVEAGGDAVHQRAQALGDLSAGLGRHLLEVPDHLARGALMAHQRVPFGVGVLDQSVGGSQELVDVVQRGLADLGPLLQVGFRAVEGLLAGSLEAAPLRVRCGELPLFTGQDLLPVEVAPALAQFLEPLGDRVRMQFGGIEFFGALDQPLAQLVVRPVLPIAHFLQAASHPVEPALDIARSMLLRDAVVGAARSGNGLRGRRNLAVLDRRVGGFEGPVEGFERFGIGAGRRRVAGPGRLRARCGSGGGCRFQAGPHFVGERMEVLHLRPGVVIG